MVIDYSKIDDACVVPVTYFNSIGMTTQFCCSSHADENLGEYPYRYYIIFDKCVTDEQVADFLANGQKSIDGKRTHHLMGKFSKWARVIKGEITSNWTYDVSARTSETAIALAEKDLNELIRNYEVNTKEEL